MRQIIFLTFTITIFSCSHAQRLNRLYYGISSDSAHNGHQLEFKTDTTVEISTFPRHMSQQFRMTLNYKRTGKTIRVINKNISNSDSTALSNQGFRQFLKEVTFAIDNKAIVDTSSKMVYVLYKDFRKKYYLIYLIDGKIYKQETGLSDAYSLIANNPKENKMLKDKLASIKDDLDNYTVHVFKGLEAYKKFGYNSVFGVIELRRRN